MVFRCFELKLELREVLVWTRGFSCRDVIDSHNITPRHSSIIMRWMWYQCHGGEGS